jgi:flavin reductase (DIM6/NTAB) family NADH-FMN oxidoreductase RutF/flavodoxin
MRYKEWTKEQIDLVDSSSVAVLYASAYGNTAALAQAISRGITKAGVGVNTLNLEQCGADEVEEAISKSDGFVIGSPTLGGHMPTQVQTALGTVMRVGATNKIPCGVFGSFGWSGEAVDMMEGKLKDAAFPFAFPSIRCKFKPTEAMLQICEQSGTDLAQTVKKNIRIREKAAAQKLSVAENASGTLLATGRIIGSLFVLTAKDGDAESGMLASWVSQASFDPPGLTVAVKKDRAIESLLPIGGKFVLNVLAEGRDRPIMREMVKQFAPGEDRFANLNTERSESSGAIILTDAASYLECEVSQRMETGDHWLLYATVQDGKVLDEATPAAVHFRKVGSNY